MQIQIVVAMAKKTLWIDNTVPPTDFIWLKLDADGKEIGYFEHNGKNWVSSNKYGGSTWAEYNVDHTPTESEQV